jgi:hypothetical protein
LANPHEIEQAWLQALYANLQILVKADPYYMKLQLFTTREQPETE